MHGGSAARSYSHLRNDTLLKSRSNYANAEGVCKANSNAKSGSASHQLVIGNDRPSSNKCLAPYRYFDEPAFHGLIAINESVSLSIAVTLIHIVAFNVREGAVAINLIVDPRQCICRVIYTAAHRTSLYSKSDGVHKKPLVPLTLLNARLGGVSNSSFLSAPRATEPSRRPRMLP